MDRHQIITNRQDCAVIFQDAVQYTLIVVGHIAAMLCDEL